eukprot:scaffold733_cov267-Pinguiococcus_pyrenoidosus.AAC.57
MEGQQAARRHVQRGSPASPSGFHGPLLGRSALPQPPAALHLGNRHLLDHVVGRQHHIVALPKALGQVIQLRPQTLKRAEVVGPQQPRNQHAKLLHGSLSPLKPLGVRCGCWQRLPEAFVVENVFSADQKQAAKVQRRAEAGTPAHSVLGVHNASANGAEWGHAESADQMVRGAPLSTSIGRRPSRPVCCAPPITASFARRPCWVTRPCALGGSVGGKVVGWVGA